MQTGQLKPIIKLKTKCLARDRFFRRVKKFLLGTIDEVVPPPFYDPAWCGRPGINERIIHQHADYFLMNMKLIAREVTYKNNTRSITFAIPEIIS